MSRTLGATDPVAGRAAYQALGELTTDDFAYLARQPSDAARRATITTWYGRLGGRYAWVMYRAALRAAGANRP